MHGFINIDKPAGWTSADVVRKLKPMLPRKTKIGHTGTLDPNVTGVLTIAIGSATKTIEFMDDEIKVYHATMQFGLKTDTADIWGEVIETRDVCTFDNAAITKALEQHIGEITQTPPMVSALKHKGKRLYELARQGIVVERKARPVTIHSIENILYEFPNLSFTVTCSRGTYIRTLCESIADSLDSIATMTALIRLQTGPFKLGTAMQLDDIKRDTLASHLLPMDMLFSGYPKINVDLIHANHLLNGVKVDLNRFNHSAAKAVRFTVYYNENLIGVAEPVGRHIFMKKRLTHISKFS